MSSASLSAFAGLNFVKMTGTGNDFILMDNRRAQIPPELMSEFARAVCCRRRSVGADGLILLSPSDRVDSKFGKVDFRWDFYNADGSSAEMCGNGGRCAARYAVRIGLAGPEMVFDTIAGPIRAWVDGIIVKLEMSKPQDAYENLGLNVGGEMMVMDGVNTGVPHAVIPVDDLAAADVNGIGRTVRFHEHFQPAGTNVNFITAQNGRLKVRTYERGVEGETLACGTGVVASALVAGRRGWLKSPVKVDVASGEELTVYFDQDQDNSGEVFLKGAANVVYEGVLDQGAFAWLEA